MLMANLRTQSALHGPATLAIDIGGTGLKASLLDSTGRMLRDEVRIATPHPCTPNILLDTLEDLVAPLQPYDRISVGFPGVVREGVVMTAPHLGNRRWKGIPFAATLAMRLKRPVRMINDAEVQGMGLITGHGLELVLTLGTGAGTALFRDGELMPHLELAQHPIHGGHTYDDYIGNRALRKKGRKHWNRRVLKAIKILRVLLNFDVLHIGGGNAVNLGKLPKNVKVGSNVAGITGGIRLWNAPSIPVISCEPATTVNGDEKHNAMAQ
jgi:polyphosphate glucokinase